MPSKRGFTLLEILIVVVVIALLMALLFPVLAKATDAGHKTNCISNQRQISAVIQLYVEDNGGWSLKAHEGIQGPAGKRLDSTTRNWRNALEPYLSIPLSCPKAHQIPEAPPNFTWGYCLNGFLSPHVVGADRSHRTVLNMSTVQRQPTTVLLAECRTAFISMTGPDTAYGAPHQLVDALATDLNKHSRNQQEGAVRHQGGSNYTFLDGHTKWYKPEAFGVPKAQNPPVHFYVYH